MEIPKVRNISASKFLKQRNQFNFLIAHISNEEVLDRVNSLSNKATGPSSIPLNLLLLISVYITQCLSILVTKLKLVQVIPIPISQFYVFDKIIEKMIHSRLCNFLETHPL